MYCKKEVSEKYSHNILRIKLKDLNKLMPLYYIKLDVAKTKIESVTNTSGIVKFILKCNIEKF